MHIKKSKMTYQFQILHTTRENILQLLNGLNSDQLNTIPPGFSNNVLWNAGHILATQQLLLYGLSGQDLLLPGDFIDRFRKGTHPKEVYEEEVIGFIKGKLRPTAQQAAMDYERGLFTAFKAYPTSYGIELKDIRQAIQFNNVHEGLHFGYMMSLRKNLAGN
ncbi:MAG: DinB family protein [Phaeodactylibacter sp.]|nr:DinB family protein [Phaeodactylibacter sp.]MCB9051284.1 DinB family protein [Lewinellaceae bacterium]